MSTKLTDLTATASPGRSDVLYVVSSGSSKQVTIANVLGKSTLSDVSDVTASATEVNVLDGIPATLTATELGYVDGVTSAIQTQITAKAAKGANSDITSLSGLTTPLTVAQGGSGAATLTGILKGNGTSSFTAVTAPSGTIVGTTDTQTLTNKQVISANNAIAASSNAATVPINKTIHTVTNDSAATLTITMTTASAVDGQLSEVRILDFSAAAQTITWVNTENSTVAAPTTSNGSTTLPLSVLFQFNSATTKWRCIAKS